MKKLILSVVFFGLALYSFGQKTETLQMASNKLSCTLLNNTIAHYQTTLPSGDCSGQGWGGKGDDEGTIKFEGCYFKEVDRMGVDIDYNKNRHYNPNYSSEINRLDEDNDKTFTPEADLIYDVTQIVTVSVGDKEGACPPALYFIGENDIVLAYIRTTLYTNPDNSVVAEIISNIEDLKKQCRDPSFRQEIARQKQEQDSIARVQEAERRRDEQARQKKMEDDQYAFTLNSSNPKDYEYFFAKFPNSTYNAYLHLKYNQLQAAIRAAEDKAWRDKNLPLMVKYKHKGAGLAATGSILLVGGAGVLTYGLLEIFGYAGVTNAIVNRTYTGSTYRQYNNQIGVQWSDPSNIQSTRNTNNGIILTSAGGAAFLTGLIMAPIGAKYLRWSKSIKKHAAIHGGLTGSIEPNINPFYNNFSCSVKIKF